MATWVVTSCSFARLLPFGGAYRRHLRDRRIYQQVTSRSRLLDCCLFAWLALWPWRWKPCVTLKHCDFCEPHSVTTQMTVPFSLRHENRKCSETAGVSYSQCSSASLEIFLHLLVQEVMNSLAVNTNITKRKPVWKRPKSWNILMILMYCITHEFPLIQKRMADILLHCPPMALQLRVSCLRARVVYGRSPPELVLRFWVKPAGRWAVGSLVMLLVQITGF
jgi:hypothetical protein